MANVKISELTAATSVAATDELEINAGGTSKKATAQIVANFINTVLRINDVPARSAAAGSTIYLAQNFGAL